MRTGAALAAVFFLTLNPASGKAETLYLPATVNFTDPGLIKEAILTDCNLPAKLVQFIKAYAIENGMTVEVVENAAGKKEGQVLLVEIVDAVSAGNAFTGHRKSTTVRGSLVQDGKEVASFTGRRVSGGGFGGGYKGSCSVLGRTVKALGKDIASWVRNPTPNAKLGDL